MLDRCRGHICLTKCHKQHRQNEPAGPEDDPIRLEVRVMGMPDTCRDHRCLTACQKQHRQNESAGQVDVPTRVEVPVMRAPRHM